MCRLSSIKITLLLSLLFTIGLNYPVITTLSEYFSSTGGISFKEFFSIFFLFIALFNIIFTLLSWPYLLKPVFTVLILCSAAIAYSITFYHVIYSPSMIETFAQTNPTEATSYINSSVLLWVLFTGLLPCLLLWGVKITYRPILQECGAKLVSLLASIGVIGLIYVIAYVNIAAIARNNRHLDQEIIPYYALKSTIKYIHKTYFYTPQPFKVIGTDAALKSTQKKPNLVVFVVGETARWDHFTSNGYARITTPNIIKESMINYAHVHSCGTLTAVSVPCMFSHMTRKTLNLDTVRYTSNAVDIMKKAGIKLQWYENDAGCKGVCDRIPTVEINQQNSAKYCTGPICQDQALVAQLKQDMTHFISEKHKTSAIFLHTQGSHGPTYYQRYTEKTKKFTPDCQRSDIQNCTHEELVNSYDNTIYATDHLLGQVVNLLKTYQAQYNVAMIYISDHGESLGENGMYLHGTPYFMAPKSQTHIPLVVWFGREFAAQNGINQRCMRNHALSQSYSQDNWFHSLLGIMNVKTRLYDAKLDVFASCRHSV